MNILFYPCPQNEKMTLGYLCTQLGYGIVSKTTAFWHKGFYTAPGTVRQPCTETFQRDMFNLSCLDLKKSTVMSVFESVFGYSLDPSQEDTQGVLKSEINSVRDGSLVSLPTQTPGHKVIQRIVNNVDGGVVVDYRVTIFGGDRIAYVVRKTRSVSTRFGSGVVDATLIDKSYFTEDEQAKIIAFAQGMGCEYCELDVLRDITNGSVYITDCNVHTIPRTIITYNLTDLPIQKFQEWMEEA
jgi:hypothetical protein